MTSSFLDSDLYPKFFLRHPGEETILAAYGIHSTVTSSLSLKEKAILTVPFHGSSTLPTCWIPKEWVTFANFTELHPPENLNLDLLKREDLPSYESWLQTLRIIQDRFLTSNLEKLVASRISKLKIASSCPKTMLSYLFAKTSHYKNRACIAVMLSPTEVFFSMSPEKLFSAKGSVVTCDLVAGTFGEETLVPSPKEIAENDYVLKDLEEHLEANQDQLSYQAISLSPMEMILSGNLYHLRRRLTLFLKENPDYLKLASIFHPTAAICGYPRTESLSLLQELEPFKRGLFAGYMGIVSQDAADLYVTIRSGLITENQIELFAGAGITADSDPEKEWDELNLKIDPYLEIFFANTTATPSIS